MNLFRLVGAVVSISLVGCASWLDAMREESNAVDRGGKPVKVARQEQKYRSRTLTGLSANNVSNVDPPVRREYNRAIASAPETRETGRAQVAPTPSNIRRMTRSDFVDSNSDENSLWQGQGQNNYLFSHNKRNELGDVISVNVERELKREIQFALWMNLPPEQRRIKKRDPASKKDKKAGAVANAADTATKAAEDAKSEVEKGKDAAEEAAKTNMEASNDVDNMRMEVVEDAGNGMVRLLGNKRVVYRGVSRVVEVVALVYSRDVNETGGVKSSSFIDQQTRVIQ